MTDFQFLQLLKREFADFFFQDDSGSCKSTLGVLELIETFKEQIQDETIKEFNSNYNSLVPDHDARIISIDKLSRRIESTRSNSHRIQNNKHPLVRCK